MDYISKDKLQKLEDHLFLLDLKPSTINRYFQLLRHLFNIAIEDGYIRKNPLAKYEFFVEESKGRALSREEVKKIFQAARQLQQDPHGQNESILYDLMLFSLYTGMRSGEILFLKWSYIRDGVINYPITATKHRLRRTAGNKIKVRSIYLNPAALAITERQKSTDDYIFPVVRRHSNIVVRPIYKIREMTGINDLTFHMIRHTVSTFLASEVSLSTAKIVLGHSDLKTTQKFYTHTEANVQKKAVAKVVSHYKGLVH